VDDFFVVSGGIYGRCKSLFFGMLDLSPMLQVCRLVKNRLYVGTVCVRVHFEDPLPGKLVPQIKITPMLHETKRPATKDELKRPDLISFVRNAVSPTYRR